MAIEFDTTVRLGFPVSVCYEMGVALPPVGDPYPCPWIADLWLEIKGRRAKWLERKLNERQWAELHEEALENHYQS